MIRKITSIALVMAFVLSFAACSSDKSGNEQETEQITSAVESEINVSSVKFELEHLSESSTIKGHFTGYDNRENELWTYVTDECPVTELVTIQEIGLTSYGYLFVADGTIYCLGITEANSGQVVWTNDQFGGATISFAFDEYENLYLSGYNGPDLMVIDSFGQTAVRYQNIAGEIAYKPHELKVENKLVTISYEGGEIDLTVNPSDGSVADIECNDVDQLKSFLCGKWQNKIEGADFSLKIKEDGTFTAYRTGAEEYRTTGEWSLEYMLASKDKLPDLIKFTVTSTDDPLLEDKESMGDYLINTINIQDGYLIIEFLQASKEDSLYSLAYDVVDPTLVRQIVTDGISTDGEETTVESEDETSEETPEETPEETTEET